MDASSLTEVDLFSSLTEDEAQMIFDLCERRDFAEGEVIFAEDDVGDELYVIEKGEVRITRSLDLGADQTLAVVGPGGIIGEMAVVGSANRSAEARASAAGSMLVLRGEDFKSIVDKLPLSGVKILQGLTLTLINRLSLTNDLLRNTMSWGLEVAGASKLGFRRLMAQSAQVRVVLMNGREIDGRLVKVDSDDMGGVHIMVRDNEERAHILPYHGILDVIFDFQIQVGKQSSEDDSEDSEETQGEG
jgi:CRP-like cAMP-binding protein